MEITLQPGDSAEGFPLSGGGEDDVWFLLFVGAGFMGGLTLFLRLAFSNSLVFSLFLFFGKGGGGFSWRLGKSQGPLHN